MGLETCTRCCANADARIEFISCFRSSSCIQVVFFVFCLFSLSLSLAPSRSLSLSLSLSLCSGTCLRHNASMHAHVPLRVVGPIVKSTTFSDPFMRGGSGLRSSVLGSVGADLRPKVQIPIARFQAYSLTYGNFWK